MFHTKPDAGRSSKLAARTGLRRGTQVVKGEVCKTFMRRFESGPRLQSFQWNTRQFNALHVSPASRYIM